MKTIERMEKYIKILDERMQLIKYCILNYVKENQEDYSFRRNENIGSIIEIKQHSDSGQFANHLMVALQQQNNALVQSIEDKIKALKKDYSKSKVIEILNEIASSGVLKMKNEKQFLEIEEKKQECLKVYATEITKEFLYKVSKVDFKCVYQIHYLLLKMQALVHGKEDQEK